MERSWLLIFMFGFTLVTGFLARAQEIYLTNAQKASISLGLRMALASQDDEGRQKTLEQIKSQLQETLQPARPRQRISVDSFGEFLEHQKNEAVFKDYKLHQLDLQELKNLLAEPEFFSSTASVQKKIENYYKTKKSYDTSLALRAAFALGAGALNAEVKSKEELKVILATQLNEHIQRLTSQFINEKSSGELVLLLKLLKAYFAQLPLEQKAEIFYRVIQLPYGSTAMDVALTMLQNAGPQMQKLVQIMGRSEKVPEKLKGLFQHLESQVKPVPWREVKKIVEAEMPLETFSYFEHKALGVGTMAQTHRAQMIDADGNKRSFVVRFLKPDIEKLLEMDHQVLKSVTREIDSDPEIRRMKLPSLQKLVDDIHMSVVEELVLKSTVDQQKIGKTIYQHSKVISFSGQKNELVISVPEANLAGQNKNLMFQELVIGKKPSSEAKNYKDIYPDLYRTVSEVMAEKWMEEAFFKSGFFHADLHQGNLMMRVLDNQINLHILDFGMTGSLTEKQRRAALMLTIGIKTLNAELVTDSFAQLSRTPFLPEQKKFFLEEIENRMHRIRTQQETKTSLEDWTSWALQLNMELQYDFIKLNRGIMAIKGLLADAKSPLNLEDIGDRIVMRNKMYLTKEVLAEPKVKYLDILRLGAESLTKKNRPAPVLCEALF